MLAADCDDPGILVLCLFGTGCEAGTLAKIAAQHFTESGLDVETVAALLKNLSTKLWTLRI